MILTYNQCVERFGSTYQINKNISENKLFKISKGFYSDSSHYSELELIQTKYPNAVLSMNSAFYYHGLTDTIPDKYYIATDKDAYKVKDDNIKQVFLPRNILGVGIEEITYNGIKIRVYDKERMLIEAVRNKNKLPYDYYKEIVNNYRSIVMKLDIQKLEDYASVFPKKRIILERLHSEVF